MPHPRIRSWPLLLTVCAACRPDPDPTPSTPEPTTPALDTSTPIGETGETGETGGTDGDTAVGTTAGCAPGGTGAFSGATSIVSAAITCNAGDSQVQYLVCTEGPSTGGWVFAQETANAQPNWSDAHTLAVIDADADGWFTELERRLATAVDISSWETDVSTLFGCRAHFEDPNVMSYAAFVVDAAGAPADCLAWGQDPQAMIDGALSRVNEPPFDLGRCRIAP